MRPTSQVPTTAATIAVNSLLQADLEADRRRAELRLAEQHHWLSQARSESPSPIGRIQAAIRTRLRPDHSLTDYPCRLADGRMGRVAVVQLDGDGDWTMVCRAA